MISKSRKSKTTKFLCLIVSLMLMISVVSLMTITASADTSANESVNEVRNSLMQVRLVYKNEETNQSVPIQGGTGFLINSNTVLTCAHVVDVDTETEDLLKDLYGDKYKEENLSLQVVVSNDVTLSATIKKESTELDFAILNLTEAIYEKESAKLGNSDEVQTTQLVYALGFPKAVSELQNKNTYTKEDVTITDGKVSKTTTSDNVDYVQHSALLTEGNSGGPLVDENGNVIGINKGSTEDYYYAISMKQITNILDALGIEYTSGTGSTAPVIAQPTGIQEPDPTEIQKPDPTEAQESDPTEVQGSENATEDDKDGDSTKLIIIIVISVLVVVLVVVIIIIAVSGKKKTNPPTTPIQSPTNFSTMQRQGNPPVAQQMGGMSQRPYGDQPVRGGYHAPSQYSGSSPTVISTEGAGATTVLNEGANETTVLGYQPAGATLLRVKNGEKVNINKPEFIIGKERRRVDYCISDNNSVSRSHARIKIRAGKCYIADLGSTNCTYVNGNKLSPNQEVALTKGDKVKISDEEFEFLG